MLPLRFLALAPVLAVFGGCGGDVAPATFVATAPVSVIETSGASTEYHLSPGDLLAISVFQVPDLTKEVQVEASGQITLPLIGQIMAAGKTPHELQVEIASKLQAKYLQSPQVSVFLKNGTGQQVTVTGSVNRPGVYPIAGQMTLIQVLALSGDVDSLGDSGSVSVFRQTSSGRQVAKFNLDDIRSGKAADPNLYPGDMIVVDTSGARVAWKNVKDILQPVVGTGVSAVGIVK